jgi:hypothetical protein
VRISFPHRYQVHQASERFLLNFALAIDHMPRNLQKGIFPRIFSPCYASKFFVSMISASTISAAMFPASMLSAWMHFISILSASLPVSQLVSTPQAFSSPHLHRTFGGKLSDPCDAWNVCCEVFELRRFAAFATFPFRHFALRTFSLRHRSNLYLSCVHRTIFSLSVTPAPLWTPAFWYFRCASMFSVALLAALSAQSGRLLEPSSLRGEQRAHSFLDICQSRFIATAIEGVLLRISFARPLRFVDSS